MLMGDSHAFGLYQGLDPYLDRQKINLISLPAMYCTPLSLLDARVTCQQYNRWLQAEVARLQPDVVVLFAHHLLWAEDEHYGESKAYAAYIWQAALRLKELGARHVMILGQIPTWVHSLPHNLNLNFLRKGLPVPDRTLTGIDPDSLSMDATMLASRLPGIDYVSLREALCSSEGCLTSVGNQYPNDLIVHDYGHLTKNGANYLAEKFIGQRIIQLVK